MLNPRLGNWVNRTYPGGSWAVTHPKKALRVATQRSFTRIKPVLPHPIAKSVGSQRHISFWGDAEARILPSGEKRMLNADEEASLEYK
jgi:hypothetical protein